MLIECEWVGWVGAGCWGGGEVLIGCVDRG